MSEKPWGRVDAEGNVYCRTLDGERLVGAYPDVTGDEALAFFERKFADLALAISLLEQRLKRGAPASDLRANAETLRAGVVAGHGVGDFASLLTRLDGINASLASLEEAQNEQNQEATDAAIAIRTAIVEQMETLSASVSASTNWKTTTASADTLFEQWQEHQKSTPRFPKAVANDLWKRFRTAKSAIDSARRAHFAQVDAKNKESKGVKETLIAKAEALASKGSAGIPAYRGLLEEWKVAPRAGRKLDDALWARFKAAGDALYEAKATELAVEDATFAENLKIKEALLVEAEPILSMTDRVAARSALNAISKKWDAAGKVPRNSVKSIEDRMRKIEAAVRKLDEAHWDATNPERLARQSELATAILEKIAKLEAELAVAQAGNKQTEIAELTAALETQKSWLTIVK
ncbi:MAG: DUF349 domain-containing protein [Microbacteriaceae bacterium]|jgi:hypothetical protein